MTGALKLSSPPSMMYDDTAAAERGCWVVAIRRVELVVVDQASAVAPDSDPELIRAVSAGLVPVNARQHETVVTAAIDRAEAFVLRLLATRDHHPLVAGARRGVGHRASALNACVLLHHQAVS